MLAEYPNESTTIAQGLVTRRLEMMTSLTISLVFLVKNSRSGSYCLVKISSCSFSVSGFSSPYLRPFFATSWNERLFQTRTLVTKISSLFNILHQQIRNPQRTKPAHIASFISNTSYPLAANFSTKTLFLRLSFV